MGCVRMALVLRVCDCVPLVSGVVEDIRVEARGWQIAGSPHADDGGEGLSRYAPFVSQRSREQHTLVLLSARDRIPQPYGVLRHCDICRRAYDSLHLRGE